MNIFSALFSMLQETRTLHSHNSQFYAYNSLVSDILIKQSGFSSTDNVNVEFGPYGSLLLPYYSMGNIDSLKLFGLDELILFSFYLSNQGNYKNVADMGANIGLHSLLMSRLGWQVTAFEPDPIHIEKINEHAKLNGVVNIEIRENAVSDRNEILTFTRLIGNRTGSHIKGKKVDVYGDIDEFEVSCLALSELMVCFDFIKMDIEGAEADAICSTSLEHWINTDVMLEIGNHENAKRIFKHAQQHGINLFSQKLGWGRVQDVSGMPLNYKEGSLFLTLKTYINF